MSDASPIDGRWLIGARSVVVEGTDSVSTPAHEAG